MNADLPRHLYAYVRDEFLYDCETGHGKTTPCVVHAVASVPGRVLAFHVLLNNGAHWSRVPIHGIVHDPDAPHTLGVADIQLWDCFGYDVEPVEFSYLREAPVDVRIGQGWMPARYVCSFDWKGNGFSESPDQHKVMHLLALENGCFALQPNNRCRFHESSFVTKPFSLTERPAYRVQTQVWHAEDRRKVEDHAFFYEVQKA